MFYYIPQDEPATERAFLVVITRPENGFAHIKAQIVRKAKASIDGDKFSYTDGKNATGWRSGSWSNSTKSGLYIDGLVVRAQMNVPEYRPYGADIRFDILGSLIERKEARLMHETFTKIDKGLVKIEESFGSLNSDDYVNLLLRVAEILKVKTFLFYENENERADLSTARFRYSNAQNLKWEVESRIRAKQPKPETVEATQ